MHNTWGIGNAFHHLLLLVLCDHIMTGRVFGLKPCYKGQHIASFRRADGQAVGLRDLS